LLLGQPGVDCRSECESIIEANYCRLRDQRHQMGASMAAVIAAINEIAIVYV